MLPLVVVVTGLVVISSATPLQVIWLVALIAFEWLRRRHADGPGRDGGGGTSGGASGGLRRPRPPTELM
jgi:hypothetical protein